MSRRINRFLAVSMLLVITLATSCEEGEKDYVVTISTKYGDMIAILYDKTPKHKANFIKLAKEKYFDGTLFHRVMQDFMIQGGDPDSKKVKPGEHLGNGGPGYSIPAEIVPEYYHEKGALAAARLSDAQNPKKESSGSQFYIVEGKKISESESAALQVDKVKLNMGLTQFVQNPAHAAVLDSLRQMQQNNELEALEEKVMSLVPRVEKETGFKIRYDNPEKVKIYTTVGGYPSLDGEYTVFGKVVKGLDVIDKIAHLQGDEADRPVEDVKMTVTVEEMSKKKITKLYGYQYPPSAPIAPEKK